MDRTQLNQELTDERPFSWIDPSLIGYLKMEDEIKRRQTEWEAVELEVLSNGVVGITLTNGKGLYAVITPDCDGGVSLHDIQRNWIPGPWDVCNSS